MTEAPTESSSLPGSALSCHYHSNEGGENGAKFDQIRALRAVCRVAGSDFHRLLDFKLLSDTNLTAPTTLNHFLPHLSRKSFIVKQKLEVGPSLSAPLRESTRLCGLPRKRPQPIAFTLLILSLLFRYDFY